MISPLLANIDLHWFEKAFYHRDGPGSWANARIVRYADDFVVLARWMSPRLVTGLESTWEVRFRLTINREKTKVVLLHHPKTSLDFLGFTLRSDRDRRGRDFGDRNVVPSEKSLGRVRDKLRFLTGPSPCGKPVRWLVQDLNGDLRGWSGYFRYGYPSQAYHKVNGWVQGRLESHWNRRSPRLYRPPQGTSFYAHVQQLGLLTLR